MTLIPKRLSEKLIISLTIIVILVEGISSYINVRTQEQQILDAMILGADQLSRGISSATWHAMLADNRDAAYELMQTIALKQGISRIRMFNREGNVVFSTEQSDSAKFGKDGDPCRACHSTVIPKIHVDAPSRARIFETPDRSRKLAIVTPILNETACSTAPCHAHPQSISVLGVLDVTLDLVPVDREVSEIEYRAAVVTGIQILLIGLFIFFFTRHFVDRPIRQLINGTRAVSEMQLDTPITIRTSAELDELVHSFNTMRERLRDAMGKINEFTQSLETKVTERTDQLRTAHQKLLQSDRLASLGQLSASVAHEINNPLSGVLNLSMLMQRILRSDGIPPERLDEFRRYLGQVVNETARVGRIVSDLLAFSRRSKPQSVDADLNTIVRTTLSLLDHKLKLMNVALTLALDDQLPRIRCDASQMQQVLINLVMNGAEATLGRGYGSIHLTTSVLLDKQRVELTVRDDGDGIAPENLSKIFDPFFTTKEEGKGVGLGLAVVYGIVESHGGEIDVHSVPGKGTTFIVTIPMSDGSPGPQRERTAGKA